MGMAGKEWSVLFAVGMAAAPAPAQDPTALKPVRVVLASSKVQMDSGAPLHFRLLQATLSGDQTSQFSGGNGFVFILSGKLDLIAGTDPTSLSEGDGRFVGVGSTVTLRAKGPRGATWLHYLLVPKANLDDKPYGVTVAAQELYRAETAVPLTAGPHEFSLTRVTSPVGAPAPPMHHRSGAALYRVIAGDAIVHLPERDEARAAGAVQYEPNGFVHTWQNTGRIPLVLLQANISAEGAPEIIWSK